MSADIDIVILRSAVVENMGVVVGIIYPYVAGNRSYIDQQKLSDFCMDGALVFQVAPCNGKSYMHAEHPELDPLGIGFDRMLKFARVAKIFEKNLGRVQSCTPHPRCSRVN